MRQTNKNQQPKKFTETQKMGEVAEIYLAMFARRNQSTVDDLRSIHRYRQEDIDYRISTSGLPAMVEVKADNHDSGNFFLEFISSVQHNETIGCFLKTKSDIWAYVFVEKAGETYKPLEMYLFPTNPFRTFIRDLVERRVVFGIKGADDTCQDGTIKHSMGWIPNIDAVLNYFPYWAKIDCKTNAMLTSPEYSGYQKWKDLLSAMEQTNRETPEYRLGKGLHAKYYEHTKQNRELIKLRKENKQIKNESSKYLEGK